VLHQGSDLRGGERVFETWHYPLALANAFGDGRVGVFFLPLFAGEIRRLQTFNAFAVRPVAFGAMFLIEGGSSASAFAGLSGGFTPGR